MLSLLYVGVSPAELNELVAGGVWDRWLVADPSLGDVSSLDELHARRGLGADCALGALVRLAARDGGDEELAAIAVVHQLQGGLRRLIRDLADLSEDVEPVVVAALWEQVRTFPWRQRTRAYASNLMWETRASALAQFQLGRTRHGREPLVFVDTMTTLLDTVASDRGDLSVQLGESVDSSADFAKVLAWARARRLLTWDDEQLLIDLVRAGYQVADREAPRTRRGSCSEAALALVAEQRGVCTKTVARQRNRVVATLRQQGPRFVGEVA